MPPKKRRQQVNNNNKENPLTIQSIIDKNSAEFERIYAEQTKNYENQIENKFNLIREQFDKYIQTHQTQSKLARLLDQEIARLNQQQQTLACQDLLNKTTDLVNTVSFVFLWLSNLIGFFFLVNVRFLANENISYW